MINKFLLCTHSLEESVSVVSDIISSHPSIDSSDGDEIDFQAFLVGLSHFNSPGRKEEKMKTAFRLHDFDDDGFISMEDMKAYLRAVTQSNLEEEVRD